MTMNQTFCVLYRAHIDLKKRVKQIGSWREIQTHRFDRGLNHGPLASLANALYVAPRGLKMSPEKNLTISTSEY